MNLFGKAKNKPQANTDTSATIVKLRETLESLDKRYVEYILFTLRTRNALRHPAPDRCIPLACREIRINLKFLYFTALGKFFLLH